MQPSNVALTVERSACIEAVGRNDRELERVWTHRRMRQKRHGEARALGLERDRAAYAIGDPRRLGLPGAMSNISDTAPFSLNE